MDSRQLIDAQFDRAVEIVQSLPKNGPIQTGYEEKLTMYSLYKQATVGNVQAPRPSVWDMLGRAKWDEWAKHKDLDPYEAKWKYVEALLKVLRRYSDKTVAMDLVRELESYSGDPSNMVMSASFSRSTRSSSSGSTTSEDRPLYEAGSIPAHLRNNQTNIQASMPPPDTEPSSSGEEEEAEDQVPPVHSAYAQSQTDRPQSSLSTHRYRTPTRYRSPTRYRTPATRSLIQSPPLSGTGVPVTQPHPEFQTQSAYAEPLHASSTPIQPRTISVSSTGDILTRGHAFSARPTYQPPSQPHYPRPYSLQGGIPRPSSRQALERAIEGVQVHLAALTERIEVLENTVYRSTTSIGSGRDLRSPRWSSTDRRDFAGQSDRIQWDLDDMGMWSIVLRPLARVRILFRYLLTFVAQNQSSSPVLVIVRRLLLDISFMLCVLAFFKVAWRRSGIHRREVVAALVSLWRAVVGHKQPRLLVDRAV